MKPASPLGLACCPLTFGKRQGNYFLLFPIFMLSKATISRLNKQTQYVTSTLLILFSAIKNKYTYFTNVQTIFFEHLIKLGTFQLGARIKARPQRVIFQSTTNISITAHSYHCTSVGYLCVASPHVNVYSPSSVLSLSSFLALSLSPVWERSFFFLTL